MYAVNYTWCVWPVAGLVKLDLWFSFDLLDADDGGVGVGVVGRHVLAVGPTDVRLQRPPRLAQLVTDGTAHRIVQVRLNVVAHLGLVLVLAVADVAGPEHALAVGPHQSGHPVLDLLVQLHVVHSVY